MGHVLKRISIIFLVLTLSSCFGGGDEGPSAPAGMHFYKTDEISIAIPDAWEVIEPFQFESDIPQNAILAFRHNVRSGIYTPNVVIIRNQLDGDIESADYARRQLERLKQELLNVQVNQNELVQITVRGTPKNTLYIDVSGREQSDMDIKRFLQISGVSGRNAYIAIGSFLPADAELVAERIGQTIRSFEIL